MHSNITRQQSWYKSRGSFSKDEFKSPKGENDTPLLSLQLFMAPLMVWMISWASLLHSTTRLLVVLSIRKYNRLQYGKSQSIWHTLECEFNRNIWFPPRFMRCLSSVSWEELTLKRSLGGELMIEFVVCSLGVRDSEGICSLNISSNYLWNSVSKIVGEKYSVSVTAISQFNISNGSSSCVWVTT